MPHHFPSPPYLSLAKFPHSLLLYPSLLYFFCPLSLVCCPPVVHLVCPPCRRCLRRPSTTRDWAGQPFATVRQRHPTQLTHNDIPQPVSNLDSRPQLFHLAYFLADWPNFLQVLRKLWPYKQGTTDKSAIKICRGVFNLKNTRPKASWLRCALQGDEAVRRDSYGAAIVGTQYWVTIWLYQLIIAGTGSVYGDIGWYLVVVGQYRVVLVDTWY